MAYALSTAITDVRRVLKDTTENVWTDDDITYFVNEAIRIVKNTVPNYFSSLVPVTSGGSIVIDSVYEYMLVLFAASRCFAQDEQDYRAVSLMNEFESRRVEMETKIYESDAYQDIIDDEDAEAVEDVYFDDEEDSDEVPELIP